MRIHYFELTPPGLDASILFAGGQMTMEGSTAVLCSLAGEPMFRIARQFVREITCDEMEKQIMEQRRLALAQGGTR